MRESTSYDDLVHEYKSLAGNNERSTAVDNMILSFMPECYHCCTEQTSVMQGIQIST